MSIKNQLELAKTITKEQAETFLNEHCLSNIENDSIVGTFQCLSDDKGKVYNKPKYAGIVLRQPNNKTLWFRFSGFIFGNLSPAIQTTTQNFEWIQKY